MRGMRLLVLIAIVSIGALVAAAPAGAATHTVSVVDFSFSPSSLTVGVGDTVTWTNNGGSQHTVTADDSSFDSGTLDPGDSFSHTFTNAGSVAYHCEFHGSPG